jgi:asparagine synthase (glutamine-hydrolysing)
MPGICGFVGTPTAVSPAALLANMLDAMRNHAWYVDHRYEDRGTDLALGRTSLGFVNAAEQPAFNEDRTLLAVMEGELYGYAERRRELTAAGHHFRSDSHAELLLHGYEAAGQAFFSDLQGAFVAALWDSRSRQLILVNDRFGMKPLYYAQPAGRLLFASEAKALLADPEVSRKPDPRGIAQYFTFGQLLAEDTLFDGIRYLPAAGWLTYDARTGRLATETHWRLEPEKIRTGTSEAELLDRIDDAFKQAVDRRALGAERLGLSLSGGLDARSILGVMEPGTPLTTVTMGMEGSIDHRNSRQMAEIAGCRHHSYYLNTQFLRDFEKHLRWLVHVTDGHYQSQCVTVPTLPLYRELGIEVLLRGHAGELLHMDKAYSYSLDKAALALRDEAALEAWLFAHLPAFVSTGGAGPLFAEDHPGQMQALARDSLRACLARSAHLDPPVHRVWHLFLTQRLRRETALSLVEFGTLVETRLPFLDNDLVDLLLAVPPEMKLGDRIQTHILRRRRPAFLGIVNTNTGAPLGASKLWQKVAKFRMRVLAKLGVRGYQPYERLGRWLRQELRPLVTNLLLSDRCLGRSVFNPQTVRAVVDGHLNQGHNHTFLLMALLIFELGQREFFDGDGYAAGNEAAANGLPRTSCLPAGTRDS